MNPEVQASGLRTVEWRRFLSAPDAELLERLYVPALSRAVRYDRCCAYFSSRVLALAARGFGPFIATLIAMGKAAPRPAIRLLVNEKLDASDVDALLATGDTTALERKLVRALKKPADALEKRRLEMLAWLVKQGLLQVRVGLPRHTGGIVHAKFGIITDAHGDCLSFMGSDNETAEAIAANYEVLEVRPSWEDPAHAEYYRAEFERLWLDKHPHVFTLPLPEAVRLKLIKMAPKSAPTVEPMHGTDQARAAMVWQFLAAAPYLADGGRALDATAPVEPWPHQVHVVEDTANAFPSGRLLCDEVGLGKTIEAILVLRRLLAGRGVKRALLLVPAGLMKQWQEELREKGGLLVPVWEKGYLTDGKGSRKTCEARVALEEPLLLLSREWARLPDNRAKLIQATPWDLVLMDEAHAARRKSNEENEFNVGNLLLELLRELQLTGHARGILLLSATPMQISPWEPWDLLSVIGVGGRWLSAFEPVRTFYDAVARLESGQMPPRQVASRVASLVASDREFTCLSPTATDAAGVERLLMSATTPQRLDLAERLRSGAPLGRRMHRSTRDTLRDYYKRGLLDAEPPRREVRDEVYDYATPEERRVYTDITHYIDARFDQLEKERGGKGFVMTIYRRRAASSPLALERSLRRRLEAVRACAESHAVDEEAAIGDIEDLRRDLDEAGIDEEIDPGLPASARAAQDEERDITQLLQLLEDLGATDSKRDRFLEILDGVLADGRSALVFSEYWDTMDYVRRQLAPIYDDEVACYSGGGGEVRCQGEWQKVSKAEITSRLENGAIRVLVCTDAASEGLNLQAASALINYDLPWNPSRVEQRIGRIDRIGQRQPLLPIVNLFLEDSVDMKVYQALRQRCGLFERFVGDMQPVLALARTYLRKAGREAADAIADIDNQVEAIRGQPVISMTFRRSSVEPQAAPAPSVTRQHLRHALELLQSPEMPVRASRGRAGTWRIHGLGKAIEVALDSSDLERQSEAVPLTLAHQQVAQIATKLAGAGIGVPLVVGEHQCGAFRACEVRWVGRSPRLVPSMDQLLDLLARWDGSPARAEDILRAEKEAQKAAQVRVESAALEAEQRQRKGLEQQVEAARLRLRRELARHLRRFGTGDLNRIWEQQMQSSAASQTRYRTAHDLLGGYVEWTTEELKDAQDFVQTLSSRQTLPTGIAPELDAAINDPRWKALAKLRAGAT